jgi:hypothetical protein
MQIDNVCFDQPVTNPDDPDCIVEDSTAGAITEILSCKSTQNAVPCWRVETNPACPAITDPVSGKPEQLGIRIDRGGAVLPPETHTKVECAIIASRNPN